MAGNKFLFEGEVRVNTAAAEAAIKRLNQLSLGLAQKTGAAPAGKGTVGAAETPPPRLTRAEKVEVSGEFRKQLLEYQQQANEAIAAAKAGKAAESEIRALRERQKQVLIAQIRGFEAAKGTRFAFGPDIPKPEGFKHVARGGVPKKVTEPVVQSVIEHVDPKLVERTQRKQRDKTAAQGGDPRLGGYLSGADVRDLDDLLNTPAGRARLKEVEDRARKGAPMERELGTRVGIAETEGFLADKENQAELRSELAELRKAQAAFEGKHFAELNAENADLIAETAAWANSRAKLRSLEKESALATEDPEVRRRMAESAAEARLRNREAALGIEKTGPSVDLENPDRIARIEMAEELNRAAKQVRKESATTEEHIEALAEGTAAQRRRTRRIQAEAAEMLAVNPGETDAERKRRLAIADEKRLRAQEDRLGVQRPEGPGLVDPYDPVRQAAVANAQAMRRDTVALERHAQETAASLAQTAERRAADARVERQLNREAQELLLSRPGEKTTLYQRVQARANAATGGAPRAVSDFATMRQGATSAMMTTARFAASGAILYGITRTLGEIGREVQELDVAMARLESQFEATGDAAELPAFRAEVLGLARDLGFASDEAMLIGIQMKGAFGSSAKAAQETGAIIRASLVTGLDTRELTDSLTAASISYSEPGVETTIEDITDKAIGLEERFGVLASESIKAFGDMGAVAQSAGLSLDEVGALLAVVQQRSGRGIAAITEGFGRILPAIQESSVELLRIYTLNENLQKSGSAARMTEFIGTSQSGQVLLQLVKDYEQLDKATQQYVRTLLGGRREANLLDPLFSGQRDLVRELEREAKGLDDNGKATERVAKIKQRLTHQLHQLQQELIQAGDALAQAGILDALVLMASGAKLVVSALAGMVKWLAALDDKLGGAITKFLAAVVAIKAVQKAIAVLRASAAAGGMTQLMTNSVMNKVAMAQGTIPGAAAGAAAPASAAAATTAARVAAQTTAARVAADAAVARVGAGAAAGGAAAARETARQTTRAALGSRLYSMNMGMGPGFIGRGVAGRMMPGMAMGAIGSTGVGLGILAAGAIGSAAYKSKVAPKIEGYREEASERNKRTFEATRSKNARGLMEMFDPKDPWYDRESTSNVWENIKGIASGSGPIGFLRGDFDTELEGLAAAFLRQETQDEVAFKETQNALYEELDAAIEGGKISRREIFGGKGKGPEDLLRNIKEGDFEAMEQAASLLEGLSPEDYEDVVKESGRWRAAKFTMEVGGQDRMKTAEQLAEDYERGELDYGDLLKQTGAELRGINEAIEYARSIGEEPSEELLEAQKQLENEGRTRRIEKAKQRTSTAIATMNALTGGSAAANFDLLLKGTRQRNLAKSPAEQMAMAEEALAAGRAAWEESISEELDATKRLEMIRAGSAINPELLGRLNALRVQQGLPEISEEQYRMEQQARVRQAEDEALAQRQLQRRAAAGARVGPVQEAEQGLRDAAELFDLAQEQEDPAKIATAQIAFDQKVVEVEAAQADQRMAAIEALRAGTRNTRAHTLYDIALANIELEQARRNPQDLARLRRAEAGVVAAQMADEEKIWAQEDARANRMANQPRDQVERARRQLDNARRVRDRIANDPRHDFEALEDAQGAVEDMEKAYVDAQEQRIQAREQRWANQPRDQVERARRNVEVARAARDRIAADPNFDPDAFDEANEAVRENELALVDATERRLAATESLRAARLHGNTRAQTEQRLADLRGLIQRTRARPHDAAEIDGLLEQELQLTLELANVIQTNRRAQLNYEVAIAEANGEVVRALGLRVQDASAAVEALRQQGVAADDARMLDALGAEASALAAQRRGIQNDKMTDWQFLYDMGEMSIGAYLENLRGLLATVPATDKAMQQQIRRMIKQLEDSAGSEQSWNIGDIELPTLYEARRLGATRAAGVGYNVPRTMTADNRTITVTNHNYNAQDYEGSIAAMTAELAAPARVGSELVVY